MSLSYDENSMQMLLSMYIYTKKDDEKGNIKKYRGKEEIARQD